MRGFFIRHYERAVAAGLILCVWFGACARAAHDVWAASALFGWITLLACVFCAGRWMDEKPIRAPLAAPSAAFLAGAALSLIRSFDRNTTLLELWMWFFGFLAAFLFLNTIEDGREAESYLAAAGASLWPLAVLLFGKIAPGSALEASLLSNPWKQRVIVGLFLGCFYGFLYLILRNFEDRKDPAAFGVLSVLAVLHVLLLSFTHWTIGTELDSPLINHNVLVGFALSWFFVLWKKMFEDGRYLFLFLPCFFILATERSWWSFAAITAGLLIYYHEDIRRNLARHKAALGSLAALGAAFLCAAIALKARQRGAQVLGISRLTWWTAAGLMFLRQPWTGVGLGGFATACPFFKSGPADNTLFAHSFPLQLLAETGIAGLVPAAWWAWNYARLARRPVRTRAQAAAQAALAAVLCFAAIHINLEYFLNKIVLLLLATASLADMEAPRYRPKPLAWLCAPPSLCLLSAFWLSLFAASRLNRIAIEYQREGDISKAQSAYENAVALDSTDADAYWGLASIALQRYKTTGSPQAGLEYQTYLQAAFRQKKEFLFLNKTYPTADTK